ncbi:MAG: hypothetical protein ACRDRN_15650 [Sciscionella sp.]
MTRQPFEPNGPEDVDAAFAEIIADLEREGFGDGVDTAAQVEPPAPAAQATPGWRISDTEWDWSQASDTEHYVPPDPPPLPKLRAGTVVALILAAIGVFLLVAPSLIGLRPTISAPMALVLLASALGLLLLRMRSGPPPDGNGAQL